MSSSDAPGVAARIIDLYERHAAAFDRDRDRDLQERVWLDQFLALLPATATVLDLGCGMAEPIAQYLIASRVRVVGVDASSAMIARCISRFPSQRWLVADMRALALDDAFDGLLVWDSFFHLPTDDQRAMFRIFATHARPGAPLLFTSGPADGEAIGEYCGEPLYHASLSPDEYRHLLTAHGFEVSAVVLEDHTCGDHSVWLAVKRPAG